MIDVKNSKRKNYSLYSSSVARTQNCVELNKKIGMVVLQYIQQTKAHLIKRYAKERKYTNACNYLKSRAIYFAFYY